MNTSSRSKKVLAPLAVLLAAGALAVGSGADFTSTSSTIGSVTAGTLKHTNDGATFDLTNLKPGKAQTGSVTLTNTGSMDAVFSLTEPTSNNGFTPQQLDLKITQEGVTEPKWSGEFGALANDEKVDLGVIPAGESRTYTFEVLLKSHKESNDDQGKVATASYTWNAVQN